MYLIFLEVVCLFFLKKKDLAASQFFAHVHVSRYTFKFIAQSQDLFFLHLAQYVTFIIAHVQLSNLEVWFQRPKDIVHKLQSGDLDIGIVGFDSVSEYGQVRI